MRKISLLVVAALAFAACQRVNVPSSVTRLEATQESLRQVELAEAVDGSFVETKSNISDAGAFIWHDWDRIGVLSTAGSFVPFDLDGGAGTSSASFLGTFPEGASAADLAIYPHGAHKWSSGALTVNYPAEYTYPADTTDTAAPMLSLGTMDNLTFKHVGGIIRIRYKNVPTTATSVKFTFPNQRVTGDFPVDITATEPSAAVESGSSTVTIHFTSPTEPKNTRHFYIPVPTGQIEGIKIEYFDATDTYIKGTRYESDATFTISRRTLLRMPGLVLTVINAGIE